MGDKQRKLKDKASRAYSDGDLKDALKLYQRVVFEDATELQCQLKIGDIYRKLGNFDAAIAEYGPVARAYAEDGLLLKAIAVCKMILGIDAHHADTQAMLSELHSKRRGPSRMPQAGPPVTLQGMGISPPSTGVVPGSDYGMIDLEGGAAAPAPSPSQESLVAPQAPAGAPSAWPASAASPDTPAGWPTSNPSTPDTTAESAPPAASWPVSAAPPAAAWPTSNATTPTGAEDEEPKIVVGARIEDSELDITVGDEVFEDAAEPVIELTSPVTVEVEADDGDDTEAALASLLTELSDDSAGPVSVTASAPSAPSTPGAPEETWDGVIRIEDVDGTPAAAEVIPLEAADVAATAEAPIELTDPIERSIEDSLGDGLARPQIPLFSDLPKNAFIELLVQMEMREMEPGDYIIREGDEGDSFFVVASGRVRVMRRGEDGRDVDLAILTDGAFFGEMALLQDGARTASVVVEEESQIFEISKEVLDSVVGQYPSVATVLRNFYRQRLLSTAMATHPVFRPFSPDERRDLMELFKSKNFDEGEILLEQGKKGTGLFILLYGALEVAKDNDGEELVLATLGPGDMFGEMSLLTGQPTVAKVQALTDCFVLRLSKKKFDEVIMTHPQILELVALVSDERASINDALLGDEHAFTAGAVLV